jgi:hypothetical protein
VKDQFASSECSLQSSYKLAAENLAEHLHWKKEVIAWMDPSRMVRRQTAGRDNAMDVRMMEESPTIP